MYGLDGKVAIITGCARKTGIGRAIALRLAREGTHVVLVDRTNQLDGTKAKDGQREWRGLESLAEEIEVMKGRRAQIALCDIQESSQVEQVTRNCIREFGRLDILVNNAAISSGRMTGVRTIADFEEAGWDLTMAVNLKGTFLMCRAAARHMIERKSGAIINISSIQGKRADPGVGAYCTSKFGVIGFTQTLAHELGPYGIRVNAVCPGAVATWAGRGPLLEAAQQEGLNEEEAIHRVYSDALPQIPLRRVGRPEEIANVVAFLVSSEADYITGQAINVNGGWFML
jgi:NAD(P)-dependent dehydrogenase (short-subunit alcohol dehydrogenase family)